MFIGLLERAITKCGDSSLKVALKSIHNDLLTRKGCLVPLNVAPRKCAKKDIYVIGGSKRELRSVWDRGLEMNYVSVEKFNTFSRYQTISCVFAFTFPYFTFMYRSFNLYIRVYSFCSLVKEKKAVTFISIYSFKGMA